MGEPPAQRHPGIVRPHGRRGHCPRRGLRGGVGRHIRLRAPLVRRLSALLRRVGTPRRGGHSGVPDHGQPRSVHLVAARLLLAAAQRHHAAGRPPRLRAGGARRPTAVPDRRPRLLQPDVADGRVHRRRRHARSGRAGARRPASARCGSPVRGGSAAHRPQPRSGESPGRPRRPHARGHGLLGAWAHPHEVRLPLFRRPASRVLRLYPRPRHQGDGRARRVLRHAAGRREKRAGVHPHGKRRVAADARGRVRLREPARHHRQDHARAVPRERQGALRGDGGAHRAGGRDPDARHARPRRCDRRPAQTRERCVFGILLRRVDEPHGAAARQGGAAPRRAVPCGVPAGGGRAAAQSRRGHRVFAG